MAALGFPFSFSDSRYGNIRRSGKTQSNRHVFSRQSVHLVPLTAHLRNRVTFDVTLIKFEWRGLRSNLGLWWLVTEGKYVRWDKVVVISELWVVTLHRPVKTKRRRWSEKANIIIIIGRRPPPPTSSSFYSKKSLPGSSIGKLMNGWSSHDLEKPDRMWEESE